MLTSCKDSGLTIILLSVSKINIVYKSFLYIPQVQEKN